MSKTGAVKEKLFWSAYWKIYGALCRIRPYQRLVGRGTELLQVKAGGKYLDLACGPGISTHAIVASARGGRVEVIGLDYSQSALEIARRRYPGIEFVFGDFSQPLPFRPGEFDGVFANNALYLAQDPVLLFARIHQVLKAGGRLVMSNPRAGAKLSAIMKGHIRMSYEEFLRSSQNSFWAKVRTIPEAIFIFGAFLAFLPFQIALKSKAGGAANFWDEGKWRQVLDEASRQGGRFTVLSVELSYAEQNTTFVLQKE